MSEPGLPAADTLDAAAAQSLLRAALPAALPGWLAQRRWYADKGRVIRGVELVDALVVPIDDDLLALVVGRLAFADGDMAQYFLPLALTRFAATSATPDLTFAGSRRIVDATETAWFGYWLLDRMAENAVCDGAWQFSGQLEAQRTFERARTSDAATMGVEQSNTSIRFDEALIIKVIRRLQPGPNPDEEVLRALSDVGFEHVPGFAGAASWQGPDGQSYPIALAQAFVPNQGDGWAWALRRLEEIAAGELDLEPDAFAPEQLLGRRTGELHVALSRAAAPAFTAEIGDAATAQENERRTLAALDEALGLLREREAMLPNGLSPRLSQATSGLAALSPIAAGYDAESGMRRLRVHGDFHLGQTLRTFDGDWTIIDFEGEPARPVAERRRKLSPLKDVAGMLRSFAYARGVAEKSSTAAHVAELRARLAAWERGARAAFLAGYREAVRAAPFPLVPENDAAFQRALAAWELDKALYEIAYEARNRPDWLEIPLRGLLPNLEDQPDEPAGGAAADP